jgi:hypothetical protein
MATNAFARLRSELLPGLETAAQQLRQEFPSVGISVFDAADRSDEQVEVHQLGLDCDSAGSLLRLTVSVSRPSAEIPQVDFASVVWGSKAEPDFSAELELFIQPNLLDKESLSFIGRGERLISALRTALTRGTHQARLRLDRPRVRVMFEDMVKSDSVPLSRTDEVFDSSGRRVVLSAGVRLHLYLLASGVAERNDPPHQWTHRARWRCRIDECARLG